MSSSSPTYSTGAAARHVDPADLSPSPLVMASSAGNNAAAADSDDPHEASLSDLEPLTPLPPPSYHLDPLRNYADPASSSSGSRLGSASTSPSYSPTLARAAARRPSTAAASDHSSSASRSKRTSFSHMDLVVDADGYTVASPSRAAAAAAAATQPHHAADAVGMLPIRSWSLDAPDAQRTSSRGGTPARLGEHPPRLPPPPPQPQPPKPPQQPPAQARYVTVSAILSRSGAYIVNSTSDGAARPSSVADLGFGADPAGLLFAASALKDVDDDDHRDDDRGDVGSTDPDDLDAEARSLLGLHSRRGSHAASSDDGAPPDARDAARRLGSAPAARPRAASHRSAHAAAAAAAVAHTRGSDPLLRDEAPPPRQPSRGSALEAVGALLLKRDSAGRASNLSSTRYRKGNFPGGGGGGGGAANAGVTASASAQNGSGAAGAAAAATGRGLLERVPRAWLRSVRDVGATTAANFGIHIPPGRAGATIAERRRASRWRGTALLRSLSYYARATAGGRADDGGASGLLVGTKRSQPRFHLGVDPAASRAARAAAAQSDFDGPASPQATEGAADGDRTLGREAQASPTAATTTTTTTTTTPLHAPHRPTLGAASAFVLHDPPDAPPSPVAMPGAWSGATTVARGGGGRAGGGGGGGLLDADHAEDGALLLPPPLLDNGSDAQSFEGLLGVRRMRQREEALRQIQRMSARNRPVKKKGMLTALGNFVRAAHAADQAMKASRRRAHAADVTAAAMGRGSSGGPARRGGVRGADLGQPAGHGSDWPAPAATRRAPVGNAANGGGHWDEGSGGEGGEATDVAPLDLGSASMRRSTSMRRTSSDVVMTPSLQPVPEVDALDDLAELDAVVGGEMSTPRHSRGSSSSSGAAPPSASHSRRASLSPTTTSAFHIVGGSGGGVERPRAPFLAPIQASEPPSPFTPLGGRTPTLPASAAWPSPDPPSPSPRPPQAPRLGPSVTGAPPPPLDFTPSSSLGSQPFRLALNVLPTIAGTGEARRSAPTTPRLTPLSLEVIPAAEAGRASPPSTAHDAWRGSRARRRSAVVASAEGAEGGERGGLGGATGGGVAGRRVTPSTILLSPMLPAHPYAATTTTTAASAARRASAPAATAERSVLPPGRSWLLWFLVGDLGLGSRSSVARRYDAHAAAKEREGDGAAPTRGQGAAPSSSSSSSPPSRAALQLLFVVTARLWHAAAWLAPHALGFAAFVAAHLVDASWRAWEWLSLGAWFCRWLALNLTGQTVLSRCVVDAYRLIAAEWATVALEDHEERGSREDEDDEDEDGDEEQDQSGARRGARRKWKALRRQLGARRRRSVAGLNTAGPVEDGGDDARRSGQAEAGMHHRGESELVDQADETSVGGGDETGDQAGGAGPVVRPRGLSKWDVLRGLVELACLQAVTSERYLREGAGLEEFTGWQRRGAAGAPSGGPRGSASASASAGGAPLRQDGRVDIGERRAQLRAHRANANVDGPDSQRQAPADTAKSGWQDQTGAADGDHAEDDADGDTDTDGSDDDSSDDDLVVIRQGADVLEFTKTPRLGPRKTPLAHPSRRTSSAGDAGVAGYFDSGGGAPEPGESARSIASSVGTPSHGGAAAASSSSPTWSLGESPRALVRTIKWASRLAISAYGLHVTLIDLPPTFTPSGQRFSRQTFAHLSRLRSADDVLHADIQSLDSDGASSYSPTFYLVRDLSRRVVVVSVRGTQSLQDIIVDLEMVTARMKLPRIEGLDGEAMLRRESSAGGRGPEHDGAARPANSTAHANAHAHRPDVNEALVCHAGILRAARALLRRDSSLFRTLSAALEENEGFGVVFTGHSLGAAIASTAALLLSEYRVPTAAPGRSAGDGGGDGVADPRRGQWVTRADVGLPAGRPIRAVAFAHPATVSASVAERASLGAVPLVVGVVLGPDIIPRCGHGQARELRRVLGALSRVRRRAEASKGRGKQAGGTHDGQGSSGGEGGGEDARVHIVRSWWEWRSLRASLDEAARGDNGMATLSRPCERREAEARLARIESQLWRLRRDVEADLYAAVKRRIDEGLQADPRQGRSSTGGGGSGGAISVPPSPWVGPRGRDDAPLHQLSARRQALDARTLLSEERSRRNAAAAAAEENDDDDDDDDDGEGRDEDEDEEEDEGKETGASARRGAGGGGGALLVPAGSTLWMPLQGRGRLYRVTSPLSFFSLPELHPQLFGAHLPAAYEAKLEEDIR